MQFYLNGYNPGDPDIQAAAPSAETRPAALPDSTDVLIVGTGPAGMLLAAQLSAFPGITTRIVDRREGPLQVGQADGAACRTDVRRLWPERETRPRSLLGERDGLLASVTGGLIENRPNRARAGYR
jgi:threonine dehydrogenase-like Zn-dependent dehydrogenase